MMRGLPFLILALLVTDPATADAPEGVRWRFQQIDAEGISDFVRESKGRVLLVYVWATWCRACLPKLPELQRLADKHKRKGLRVVGVSVDAYEKWGALNDLLAKYRITFRNFVRPVVDFNQESFELALAGGPINNYPTVVVFDRRGERTGVLEGQNVAEYEEQVLRVLTATPVAAPAAGAVPSR